MDGYKAGYAVCKPSKNIKSFASKIKWQIQDKFYIAISFQFTIFKLHLTFYRNLRSLKSVWSRARTFSGKNKYEAG